MPTIQERFEAAIEAAQHGGVHIRVNVMECCRSCIGHEKLGINTAEELDTTPIAYHYGGQGSELVWHDGQPRYMNELDDVDDDEDDAYCRSSRRQDYTRPVEVIHFNHGGPDLTAAEILAECFRMQGFSVTWDGTKFDTVQVHV